MVKARKLASERKSMSERTGNEMDVKRYASSAILGLAAIGCALPSAAEVSIGDDGLRGDFGKLQLRAHLSASAQGALIDPLVAGSSRDDSRLDGSARFSLEYTTDNAIILGAVGEIDSGNDEIEGFERDELYVFVASDWGRVELGENDGPADTLSYHAPVIGLGQVRGDFARYEGSIALLSPYDTRDAAKVTYLSPPINGIRVGVSYAPEFNINENDADPARRLLQQDVVEFAGQYNTVWQGTTFGASAAYVIGTNDSPTAREDIESWSIGAEINRGRISVGAAYVDRGRSNLLASSPSESEWNAGVEYQSERWSIAASTAISDERDGTISRYGVGGTFDITEHIYAAADIVLIEESFQTIADRDATVGVLEIGVRY